jgi:segregation and condensation protein B
MCFWASWDCRFYAIHLAMGGPRLQPLSRTETLVLTAIVYFQPITRGELSQLFGKEVSRDVIGQLRALNFIAAGPRSPQPGALYTYVTTKQFLSHFGFDTFRDLPDME